MKSQAPILPPEPLLTTKEDIVAYATKKALEANIEPSTVLWVIECESNYDPKAIGDGNTSFGLVQINLPSHPDVSREMAEEPKWAIDFLINNLREGRGSMWTCWRMRY